VSRHDSPAARTRRWRVVLSVTLLAAIATLVTLGVADVLNRRGEHGGQVTVRSCTHVEDRMHGSTYSCTGSFVADDDTFDIPVVTFFNDRTLVPGTRAAATVSGPGDGTAALQSETGWRLAVTGGGALLLLAVQLVLWRTGRLPRPRAT
jgi:hypothetical protein